MRLLHTHTLEEVQEQLKTHFFQSPHCEVVPIRQALGRYLAENITTDVEMPQFRRSVIDGYAVHAHDTFGVSDSMPVFLDVVGAVEMGHPCQLHLQPNQAIYVPTGGMLPQDADAMVMVEYVEKLDEKTIAVYKPATPNGHIMNQGDDFSKNQLIFSKGHRISVKDIGMLATCGKWQLQVFVKPKAAILSTGDEIIDIDQIPELGQIRDINAYAIAAFCESAGVEVTHICILKDNFEQLTARAESCILENDILLLSGGSSAGTKDMTADLIDSLGKPGVLTHGIAIKPGKPTVIGVVARPDDDQCPILAVGLPGHPMSAIIVYKTVIEPFIKSHYFENQQSSISVEAVISENIHAGEGRETYQLVTLKKSPHWVASPIHAKSGSISQLMYADG
ncbi:MAG: molybdopterin molybdotransferase MoeA, partial [Anaerovorax sp.]